MSAKSVDLSTTSEYWDKFHFDKEFLRGEWSFHPVAKARLHKILGASSREVWFYDRYLKGRKNIRALGIGVGRCMTELNILSISDILRYDLYDVSPAALDDGRKYAKELGVSDRANFICADVHEVDLPEGSYDVITFIASLHHIEDLEGTLRKCERALAPEGVLWAAEYIGPNYFDYPEEHRDFARRFWRTTVRKVKKTWIPELQFPTVEEVIAADPTESIHSSDIPRVMQEVFEKVDTIPTYGTFAFILFWGLNHDVLYETELGREFVRTVIDMDTALIDSGALPHYFAYLIGKKPAKTGLFSSLFGRRGS